MKITEAQMNRMIESAEKDGVYELIAKYLEQELEENNKVYTLEFYDENIGVYSSLEKAEQAYKKAEEKGLDNLLIMSFDLDSEDFNDGKTVDENG